MKNKKYLCSQCCMPYKSEKQAKMCEEECRKNKSCNLGITIEEMYEDTN